MLTSAISLIFRAAVKQYRENSANTVS